MLDTVGSLKWGAGNEKSARTLPNSVHYEFIFVSLITQQTQNQLQYNISSFPRD